MTPKAGEIWRADNGWERHIVEVKPNNIRYIQVTTQGWKNVTRNCLPVVFNRWVKTRNATLVQWPWELEDSNGLTVSKLIQMLKTANPDALVILRPENCGWHRCRKVALESHNFGGEIKPTVDFF